MQYTRIYIFLIVSLVMKRGNRRQPRSDEVPKHLHAHQHKITRHRLYLQTFYLCPFDSTKDRSLPL